MALEAKLLTFTSSGGLGVDQDLTGTTFQPKAAIIWTTRVPNAADAFNDAFSMSYGFTDGTNSACICGISEDAQATSDAGYTVRDDSLLFCVSPTNSTAGDCQATFVSWLSNGMRINWADNPAAAFKFHVLFLGGSDLTNVAVGTWNPAFGTTGVSFTGLGFQPDFLQLLDTRIGTPNSSINTDGYISIGSAISSSAQWSVAVDSEDGRTTMDTWQAQDDTKILTSLTTNTGVIAGTTSLVSFNSNGWTVDNSVSRNGNLIPYLALKGGSYAVGKITEPGSTGNQTITTSKDTKAVMIYGIGTTTIGSSVTGGYSLSVGGGTSSSEMAVTVVGDLDAAADSAVVSRYETSSVYLKITPNATATSSTIDDEASLSSVASDGFTLNWSNIGGTLPLFYVAFGNAAGGSVGAVEELLPHAYAKIHCMYDNNTGVAIFG